MEDKISKFLSGLPVFSGLPKKEVSFVVEEITIKKYPKTTILSVQGRTKLDCVYIIKEGRMELFYESHGEKNIKGFLEPGDTFGGVSILMNAGISVRTVQVIADATLYVLSQKVFLEVCTRNKKFYEHFAGRFRAQMSNESYASIVAAGQALHFISGLVPFTFLPEEEISRIAASISIINYPEDTMLFIQGQSKLEYLYIIKKGAADRYFEEKDKKTLRGMLGEGDMYGGISMLMNKGLAIRSLRVTEDSYFYILSKEIFLDVCQKYEAFSDYFTDTFGKRMLDRSYAEIIAGNFRPAEISPEFFNQPVESIVNRELVYCDHEMPIQAAAAVMSQHNSSSIFIREADGEFVGVVTDNDLRKKVTATGYDILKPVSGIMTSPLVTVPSQALIFESMMEMMQKNIKHLAIRDSKNKVVGVITNRDLLKAQGQSPFFIVREIAQARFVNQIVQVHRQVPQLIQALINTGAKAQNVTRFLTTVSDAILQKLIGFAIDEMGPPPARFVFMILGSEGRKEQTLKTDQDNAIIIEDLPAKAAQEAMGYFLNFSEKVCGWLDEVGYDFCKGGVMAKNRQWCQPLKVWKNYFKQWIHTAEPEALLQASIFFDFRGAYGETDLIDELRDDLFKSLVGWPGFFRHLAENAVFFTPPIGFFRNFLVESKGEHRDSFDIKAAMRPVVDYARIYALSNRIAETNTLGRLHELLDQKQLSAQQYQELDTVYSYLMQQRFVRQIKASIEENGKPDNYINPKKLSRIEQTTLKEIFKRIEKFQAKLSFDFTGMA
ncbi:Predicted signal-transduction protein containing cAMP-binding and CBS domains [Olavius sp. associated proteobacterium Delta 1]|nr:Predicted signal-transduction protein containing cAMP-binding and CBS domains [Olavius sp. associated proteobacterium Delta 1]